MLKKINKKIKKRKNICLDMKKKIIIFIIILVLLIGTLLTVKMTGNTINSNTKVKLETSMGDIVIELHKEMSITAENFENLVKQGFYDGVIFHRVIDGFMIQGGDPTGTGSGGPGYTIQDEFTQTDLDKNNRGTISMANAGPNSGGSQFFINLVDNNFLDGKHPVFGIVIEGMDVVDAIAKVKANDQNKPLQDVTIIKATIIRRKQQQNILQQGMRLPQPKQFIMVGGSRPSELIF